MFSTIHGISIRGVSAVVPKNRLNFLESNLFPEQERIVKTTGIEEVRITTPNQRASDLGLHAAQILMEDLKLKTDSVDAFIFASAAVDQLIPATSYLLHEKLGLRTDAACFDLLIGCSGYIYSVYQACLLVASGSAKTVLVIVCDASSKIVDPNDQGTRSLFGDAASATVIQAGESSIFFNFHSNGTGHKAIFAENSGFQKNEGPSYLKMNGLDVFSFAMKEVAPSIEELCNYSGVRREFLNYFVFHQANKIIIDGIRRKLHVTEAQVPLSLTRFGNTGGASIPLTLVNSKHLFQNLNEKVLLSGFGSGLSWANAIVNFKETHFSELTDA